MKQADINDTELINKIKENLNKAKENVQGIKVKLGLDVDVKTNKEMLDKVEKDLKSQLDDLKAGARIAVNDELNESMKDLSKSINSKDIVINSNITYTLNIIGIFCMFLYLLFYFSCLITIEYKL